LRNGAAQAAPLRFIPAILLQARSGRAVRSRYWRCGIAFRPAETTVHVAEQAADAIDGSPLGFGLHGDQASLAAGMMGADVDHQAMAVIGLLDVDEQRLRLGQPKVAASSIRALRKGCCCAACR
jgi:hypothetical protein